MMSLKDAVEHGHEETCHLSTLLMCTELCPHVLEKPLHTCVHWALKSDSESMTALISISIKTLNCQPLKCEFKQTKPSFTLGSQEEMDTCSHNCHGVDVADVSVLLCLKKTTEAQLVWDESLNYPFFWETRHSVSIKCSGPQGLKQINFLHLC